MGLKLRIQFLAFLIFVGFHETFSACNIASCPQSLIHVCNSENSFFRCTNGIPITTKAFDCPKGYVCVHDKKICEENGKAACKSGCGLCDETTSVACISKTDFAFCVNNEPQSSMSDKCETNQNCLASDKNICVANTTPPSCPKLEPEIPTPPTPTDDPGQDIVAKCTKKNKPGKYPTNNCKKYIYCYIRAGGYAGNIYDCPGETQFNCESQQCESKCISSCPKL